MDDIDDDHGLATFFIVMVEEIQSGHRLAKEHLETQDEVQARKVYQELSDRGYQVRLVKEIREFWKIEQTKDYGKV